MRSTDWSTTPVGPVEFWPESLKISVAVCLRSKFPIVIWWGREHLTQFYNDAYISFLGRTKHPRALGQSVRECWKELWHIIGPMLDGVFRTGEATWSEDLLFVIERALPREEGYFTFSYSGIPQDGEVGGIFCACVETTDRVIGDRQLSLLRALAAKTAEARTWQRACQLSANVLETDRHDLPFSMIYIVDEDTPTVSLAATSGIPGKAAPQGGTLEQGGIWPFTEVIRGNAPRVILNLQDLLPELPQGPWPQPPDQAVALPISQPGQTGRAGVLLLGLSPYRPLDSKYQRFLGLVASQISANIADAYSYEQERKRAEALAELDRAKTVFFSNVSHEFRTPLTLMLGPIESMLEQARPSAIVSREELQLVHRNSMRLLKLVNTLLDFSRIEAGRAEAIYEPTNLATFTADTASAFRSAMEQAGLQFVVDCEPLSEPVYVDRDMWEKIVLNLISNAFKFTLLGGVTVRLSAVSDHVELQVADTGSGIPEDQQSRVFERFHRIEGLRGRSHEGTGIGLALVQELVKLHHGSIRLESAVGKGSTFTVSIPRDRVKLPADGHGPKERLLKSTGVAASAYVEEALQWLPEAAQPSESPQAFAADSVQAPHVQTTGGTILLADDNADMRRYVRRLLGENYNVQAVADGAEALAAIRRNPPDLVLTDVMMPELDGFGLLRELRATESTSTIPVILLSAKAGEDARIEGLQAGADDYMVKPFTARELLARVGAHLALGRMRHDAAERERALRTELEIRVQERTAELQLANEELRELSSRLQKMRDDERRRIARELHDSVGQLLTALSMNISIVQTETHKLSPDAVKRVQENASLIEQLSTEIRTMSHLLHPPLLDEIGLSSALEWYVEGFATRSGIAATIDIPGDLERLPADMEIAIFRAVQESLTNVHRHSGSRSCWVKVTEDKNHFRVEIKDSGKGIPKEKRLSLTSTSGGVGLRGMQERIRQLGGTLEIESSDVGTTVMVTLPRPKGPAKQIEGAA